MKAKLKEIQSRLQKVNERLSLIEFDQKDLEFVKLERKYKHLKQNG